MLNYTKLLHDILKRFWFLPSTFLSTTDSECSFLIAAIRFKLPTTWNPTSIVWPRFIMLVFLLLLFLADHYLYEEGSCIFFPLLFSEFMHCTSMGKHLEAACLPLCKHGKDTSELLFMLSVLQPLGNVQNSWRKAWPDVLTVLILLCHWVQSPGSPSESLIMQLFSDANISPPEIKKEHWKFEGPLGFKYHTGVIITWGVVTVL